MHQSMPPLPRVAVPTMMQEMAASMVSDLQADASVFGVSVQRICIVEARYAAEIASQMLMKQQANAMVDARKGEEAM